MTTASGRALGLVRFAETLAARGENKTALVIDLAGIPEANERMFFRSLVRYVEERTADLPNETLPLARHFIALLADAETARKIKGRLETLSDFLAEKHHGSIRVQSFDLAHDSKRFVDTCNRLIEQAPLPPGDRSVKIKDPAPPGPTDLDQFLMVQRALGNADISSLIRSQDLWLLIPGKPPAVFARDTWVSIPAIESRLEIPLVSESWLLGRTAELADSRLIAHLLHEEAAPPVPRFIGVHVATVFSGDFRQLLATGGQDRRQPPIFELSLEERQHDAGLFDKAIAVLRDAKLRIVLGDVLGPDLLTLQDADYQHADWIRLDSSALQLGDGNQLERIKTIGPERFILCECNDDAVVQAGLRLGIRRFQGRAVNAAMKSPEAVERLLGAGALGEPERGQRR